MCLRTSKKQLIISTGIQDFWRQCSLDDKNNPKIFHTAVHTIKWFSNIQDNPNCSEDNSLEPTIGELQSLHKATLDGQAHSPYSSSKKKRKKKY